ncbi:unnamed protein product [Boreogadus saida]
MITAHCSAGGDMLTMHSNLGGPSWVQEALSRAVSVLLLNQAEKETFLEPFVLKELLPASLGSYYRYTGSLTTPPCSKVVEWILFSRPVYVSYKQPL